MKKQFIIILVALSIMSPIQASEPTNSISAVQLQAAIEAFGVPKEQAEKATSHSITTIKKERKAFESSPETLIVSDDFFTLSPF